MPWRSPLNRRTPRGGFRALLPGVLSAILAVACGGAPDHDGRDLVIRNVTVLPMTSGGGALTNATVVVSDGVIRSVRGVPETGPGEAPAGAAAVPAPIPEGADVIDGTGRVLVPGLFEMHAHTSKTRASALGLYVVHGVTTIRDMGGDHQELLEWRREIRAGERLGPRMRIGGPYLESVANVERMRSTPPEEMIEPVERTRIPVGTPGEADRVVDSLARLPLDFIKIRTVTDRATYLAIGAAADRHGLPLVGHTFGLTPELILEAGQEGIEHFLFPALDSLSRGERMAVWGEFAAAGIRIVPTLVTFTESVFPGRARLEATAADTAGELDPRRVYLSRFLELDWAEQALEADESRLELFRSLWASHLRNLREMHEAGVDVLAGSDVAVIGIYPGSTLHDELALFVDSLGMSPTEALERATRRSAEFLGMADSVGTVEEGKLADLVLLDADPRADIRNTRRVSAVILRGTPYREEDFERIRQQVLLAPDQRVNDWLREPAPGDSAASDSAMGGDGR